MEKKYTFCVEPEDAGKRLDVFLKEKINELSRSRIKSLIEEGKILVNGKKSKSSYKVKNKDIVLVEIPPEKEIDISPSDVPFDILFEDEHIAVINKPPGVVVHPAPGHYEDTLVHGLVKRLKNLSGIGGKLRPGIVHRLDKDTSGIMLVAKNDQAHKNLSEAFKNRLIKKTYFAIVYKTFERKKGKIETFIGRHPVHRKKMAVLPQGREAITEYQVIENLYKASLVELKPLTGRTHQLRVHMSFLGHPILGDPVYGGLKHDLPKAPRLMLHAGKITFTHPVKKETLNFEAPFPEDFKTYLEELRKLLKEKKK
ncbi:MAG: RluA family pseudouridine synthase [Thermodesulfobacteria bacterium]|nr:RluA family pseudouridine synthase [Thermodesulfobacteriota bacterium]